MFKCFVFFIIGFSGLIYRTAYAAVPSFDCIKANKPLEKLICSDDELAKLDTELATQWQKMLEIYEGGQRASLIKGQKVWLKMRENACQNDASKVDWPELVDCVKNIYTQRIDMLKQQETAHVRFPQTDFDSLLDVSINLTDYEPKDMGAMRYNAGNDIRFDISRLPKTCRELYTYSAGNWTYTSDTIGVVSETFAKSTCGFHLLSGLNTTHALNDQEQKAVAQMNAAIQSIQDEVEFHEIKKSAFGDFTGLGRQEILAIIFSSSSGTLHFFTLYLGYYDKVSGEFKIEEINPTSIFEIQDAR